MIQHQRRRLRAVLLASATLAGLLSASPAFAQCATTTGGDGTVTLTCGTTITNSSNNSNGNNPSTNADYQEIKAPLNVSVNNGATISGWGLYVYNGGQPASATPRPINVVNNGTVSHTVGWDDPSESDGFNIGTNSGSIHYSGNGSVTTNGTANAASGLFASTALVIAASGLGNSVTVGSQAAPISATFSGEAGIRLTAENSSLDAWFAGGTITATRQQNGFNALSIQAADSINLTMTGGTVVDGGISVSLTAGPGHSASSLLTIATDARVTNSDPAGAGLTTFSREAGADVTLTSGASIDVANIGVLLAPNAGQARFTTATGTTISQTGTTGAARIGLWFNPVGTGSLLADLSGSITATGTGILLSTANGNATVTIRAGGSVSGDQAGIQVMQGAGATGLVDIRNSGTLSGAAAVTATLGGTAFALTNSGTMTGRVDVTGSSVAASQLTNSGTWNLGAGTSTFSGNVTNSGMLNMADGTINTLTINGNLVFNAGSTFRVDIDNGANDRVNVTGTATLAGGISAFGLSGSFTAGTYTLLNAAGGLSGTFSPLTTNPNTTASLRYDTNNVYRDITGAGTSSFNTSRRESIVFSTPVVTTNRVGAFSTQIIGRLLGGQPLYDQTFAAAYNSLIVQNAVTAARAAITTAGGPGVIIGDPVRTSSSTTSATTSVTNFTLTGTQSADSTVVTFGPDTILTGNLSICNVNTLPSGTRPTCQNGGTTTVLPDGDTNFNTITDVVYTVAENRTDTITDTLSETWEISGQVVAVGTIHAEVQSGLFDLGSRLLNRLTGPLPANAGWGEFYAFRVSQAGRRDARGFAVGANLGLGRGVTLAFGLDRGSLDIDVPGAQEEGDVTLTEGGAALRLEQGPFTAALSATYGAGKARTSRTILGASAARYDVRVAGVALDLGYAFQTGGWTLRPVAGLDYVSVSTDGFIETDMLGLVVGDQDAGRFRASAGLEVGRTWGDFQLAVSARYLTVLDGDERVIPVAFALAPGNVLEMTAPNEPDTALIGARGRLALSPAVSLWAAYDGRFGSDYAGHAGTMGLSVAW
jgi:hypothetical protein